MRGNIKLFTLSMDLRQAHQFEIARSEKVNHTNADQISLTFDKAFGINA
jgi:hypothetical protein